MFTRQAGPPINSFSCSSHLEHRAPFGVSVITHTKTHCRTPLDEWSARRRDLYLHRTTNTTYKRKREISMPQAGFEPATPATKRTQTYALDCAATGMCWVRLIVGFLGTSHGHETTSHALPHVYPVLSASVFVKNQQVHWAESIFSS
jgi:hypothetical protein